MSFSKKAVCPYCGAVNRIPADRLSDNPKCGKCSKNIFASKPVDLTIRSIPTMVLFKDGKEIARQSGAMMGGQIEQWVESQLNQA